jgi:perosamine synthetase
MVKPARFPDILKPIIGGENMSSHKSIVIFRPYISEQAIARVEKVLRDRWIGQGDLVTEFENCAKRSLNIPFAIAVNCSSSALRLALAICGVGPGAEVVTTPMTCTLTNHPILEQYAVPVFADIQYETGNIYPADVERRITERTKAILCTHWGGYPVDLDELNQVAHRHNLPIIQDASEAFGAIYRDKSVGSLSRFTAFSFQAIQMITTGEGGMLAAINAADAEAAKTQRWYGINRDTRKPNVLGYFDFDIASVGYGYHLTNIAAAMGIENLTTLDLQQKHRQGVVASYRKSLQNVPGVTLLSYKTDRVSSNHFFTIHVEKRDEFCRMMNARNIQPSIVHFRNDAYAVFGHLRSDLPGLERFSKTYIALPTHMYMTDEDVDRIISAIQAGW